MVEVIPATRELEVLNPGVTKLVHLLYRWDSPSTTKTLPEIDPVLL